MYSFLIWIPGVLHRVDGTFFFSVLFLSDRVVYSCIVFVSFRYLTSEEEEDRRCLQTALAKNKTLLRQTASRMTPRRRREEEKDMYKRCPIQTGLPARALCREKLFFERKKGRETGRERKNQKFGR